MRRYYFVLFSCIFCWLPLFSQTLTVNQLETKCHNLYQKGYDAFDAHDYQKAENSFQGCINLLVSNDAANSTSHIYALIKLGETYFVTGQANKQELVNKQILDIKQRIRPGSKRYVEYLYCLGLYYSNIGNNSEALNALNEALTQNETLQSMEGEESKILHRMALCYYCDGNISKAVNLEKECIEKDGNKTADYYKALAYYYYRLSDWESLESIINDCYTNSREPILRKFSQSKAIDRAEFWSSAGLFFTDYLPTYAYDHPSSILVSYTYDAELFSKGVLLAAENKTNELTLNSNDPELIASYVHYLELKGKKDKTIDEEFEMDALSDVFLKYQKEHKNEYRKDFRIRWTDVQEKLSEEDAAIEFLTIPNESGFDDYAAIIIKKGMPSPKLIKLADFKQLTSIPASRIYTTSEMYDMVWGVLEQELDGVQNVYFSPAGIFYNTGIEYLPNKDDIEFCASRNVYRLSSTKELVLGKKSEQHKSVLFGGINYDASITSLEEQSQGHKPQSDNVRTAPVDSLSLRGASEDNGFPYLEGTMEEVGDISMILLDSDISADLYTGDEGSESTFKDLSGSSIDILHIATHGFYYSDSKTGRKISLERIFKDMSMHFFSDDVKVINEDKMLTRSGLIMAGANNLLKRITIPNNVEDGIMYADEIANLNLSSVDLLVLSACQSGLGDVASSEGVFGLQRGFKLAGVHSIVMSLWKVNDEATKILMEEMYKNLSSGQSKREALFNAQIALRTVDNGRFDSPEYWAAFVLLDAADRP